MNIHNLILICTFILFNINTIFAVNCRTPGTPAEELSLATTVFSGKVFSKEYKKITDPLDKEFGNEVLVVQLSANMMWKSESYDTPVILYTGNIRLPNGKLKTNHQGFEFLLNESYLVYAAGPEKKLKASICSRTKKLSEAADEV